MGELKVSFKEENNPYAVTQNVGSDAQKTQPMVRIFGRYCILTKIDEGGMGQVFKAMDTNLERVVALKILPQKATRKSAKRFKREATSNASLNHNNIVRIYDFGQLENLRYIVMEYVEGGTLADIIEKKIPIKQTCEIILKVLEALKYAHEKSIIHRDLKPANILINRQGKPIVADFGLARSLSKDSKITQAGELIGTFSYMAPELLRGKQPSRQSDIYSLGIILYEMLTQRHPYGKDNSNKMTMIYRIVNEEVTAPTKIDSKIPEDLAAICLKAIDKDAQQRYQNVNDMLLDIRKFMASNQIEESTLQQIKMGTEELIKLGTEELKVLGSHMKMGTQELRIKMKNNAERLRESFGKFGSKTKVWLRTFAT